VKKEGGDIKQGMVNDKKLGVGLSKISQTGFILGKTGWGYPGESQTEGPKIKTVG